MTRSYRQCSEHIYSEKVYELVGTTNMSPTNFRQHFRAIAGKSPVQFQKPFTSRQGEKCENVSAKSSMGGFASTDYLRGNCCDS
jgi:hypothetical protein